MGFADRSILREEPLPYHSSPPIAPTGDLTSGARAQAMVERIVASRPASDAEALKALRAAFPDSPLGLRVAALGLLMRRQADRSAF
jgi:hypothetical protein